MTLGEERVRISFNPSADKRVEDLKRMAAQLIDACVEMRDASLNAETMRWCALAMTAFEEGAMWAVKAATSGKP